MNSTRKKVFAEISENGKWIEILFRFDPELVRRLKAIGAVFVPPERGGPLWRLALDYEEAQQLANVVGQEDLELGDMLREWGKIEKVRSEEIGSVLGANDAKLTRLPKVLPELYKVLHDYQRAGIQFAAFVDNPLIADQPGLGKTLEAIGGIFEAGTDNGPNLVVGPLTALESVWLYELQRWQPHMVFVAAEAGVGRWKRDIVLADAITALDAGMPFWLVVNPEMVRLKKQYDEDGDPDAETGSKDVYESRFPFLHETVWNNVVIDECHKNALRNPKSVTAKGMFDLKVMEGGKRIALSGTPMGGKPINMWGILHYLHPEKFTSKWRWAKQWLDVQQTEYSYEIGDIKKERYEAFGKHLAPYVLRRTKSEVLKELPDKDRHDLWCPMTPRQEEQYNRFAVMAEIKIGDDSISATSVLAEYVRLKQFADAMQEIRDGNLFPTEESGKLRVLFGKLDELGILDGDGDEQVVIASQFTRMVDMVYKVLEKANVPTLKITGSVTGKKRTEAMQNFQAGEARAMVMQTATGGLAITLDRANTVHILDETWNPDDQEQVEDRTHRASRIHQVTVFYYRSQKSIDEYIHQVTKGKSNVNKAVLDARRTMKLYAGSAR